MAFSSPSSLLLAVLGILLHFTECATTRVSEAIENEATVAFYIMPKTAFTERMDDFRTVMAAAATIHCTENYEECGLSNGWHNNKRFEKEDVEVNDADDTTDKARLLVKYFINLPRNTTATKTSYILNRGAVYSSVAASTGEIHQSMGYSVVKAGSLIFSPYPDLTVNAVMITIGLLTTFICMGILLGCRYQNRHQERKAYEASIAAKQAQSDGKKKQRSQERNRAINAYKESHSRRSSSVYKLSPTHSQVSPEQTKANRSPQGTPGQEINYPRPYRRSENRSQGGEDTGRYDSYDGSGAYHHPGHTPMRPETLNVSQLGTRGATSSTEAYQDYFTYAEPTQPAGRKLSPLDDEEIKRQKKRAKKAEKRKKRQEAEAGGERMREESYENGSYTVTEPRYRPPGPDADRYYPAERDLSYRQPTSAMNISSSRPYEAVNTPSDNSDSGLHSMHSRSVASDRPLRSTEV